MKKTTLKVHFNDGSCKCHRELELRMKSELLSHVNGCEKTLKDIYDEACKSPNAASSWEKIALISEFNCTAHLGAKTKDSIREFSFEWVEFEEKRVDFRNSLE